MSYKGIHIIHIKVYNINNLLYRIWRQGFLCISNCILQYSRTYKIYSHIYILLICYILYEVNCPNIFLLLIYSLLFYKNSFLEKHYILQTILIMLVFHLSIVKFEFFNFLFELQVYATVIFFYYIFLRLVYFNIILRLRQGTIARRTCFDLFLPIQL